MLFAAIAFAILADVILVLVALGLWSPRRPSDTWEEDVLPSSASRSSIEQRDVGEILKSDVHVPEPREAEDGEPEATPSADRAGRPGGDP